MVLRVELEQSTTRLFLQPTHPIRGCFIPCLDRCVRQTTFNQRTPYGGASLTSRILLRIILPFNQRTQYGVLHANGNLITLYMNLQPTHPVCGASVSVDGQSQHISPSTNAPSMGCFDIASKDSKPGDSFNQRTQYGVLRSDVKGTKPQETFNQRTQYGVLLERQLADSKEQLPSTNAPSMGCFAILSCFLTRLSTFNQRTQYGVLPKSYP